MPQAPSVEDRDQQHTASSWAMSYVQEEASIEPTDPGRVRLQLLTDPWSVWCWGFEPVRRTVQLRYPSIDFEVILGGMFEHLPSHQNRGLDVDPFFTMVQRTTGMPISASAIHDHRPASTYPACIHVHAVRLLDPTKEAAYLRRLREAVYLDGLNISDAATAADLAEDVGIEAQAFEEAMASGEPEREFRDRLARLEHAELYAYPTIIITSGAERTKIEGFQNIAGVVNMVESVTGARHPARPPPDLETVLDPGARLATREIAEVMGLSIEQAYDRLQAATEEGWAVHERHPSGDTWRASD